jgi:[protein-PII] uridylyltransferase
MALDNVLVQDPFGRPFDERGRLERLKTAVEDALANRTRLPERLAAKPLPRPRADAFPIAANVLIDNRASNRFTVVEVNARDRPALLYALAYGLFQSKVTIHSAHIATYGERAVDTFYVTDLLGAKITAAGRLKSLEKRMLEAAEGAAGEKAAA